MIGSLLRHEEYFIMKDIVQCFIFWVLFCFQIPKESSIGYQFWSEESLRMHNIDEKYLYSSINIYIYPKYYFLGSHLAILHMEYQEFATECSLLEIRARDVATIS